MKKITFLPGFTLIELLVVIAILGVLAGAVLIAINPLEQLSRGRDAGRKTTLAQLGGALQGYYATQGAYPAATGWMTTLVTNGEMKTTPTNPTGVVTTCAAGATVQNGFCYMASATEAVVYTRAESTSEKIKSTGTGTACASPSIAWIVWSSMEGKTGLLCQGADPVAGVTGLR